MAMQIHELGPLFQEVQMQALFMDGKTFTDCLPKRALEEIQQDYLRDRNNVAFDLKKFVLENFKLPETPTSSYKSDVHRPINEHIDKLWRVLTRQPNAETSSLIPLPKSYVVPGGRFREIYYWDSYFTLLGLHASGRMDLVKDMIENFAYLINSVGYIPNGNRTYYLGRSQPPFFSLMVQLLNEVEKESDALVKFLPALEKEYQFWRKGQKELTTGAAHCVVKMPSGAVLKCYW
ncbi:MAG: trehalase family glycosidase, partial [Flammeovirgaceae bacterium]